MAVRTLIATLSLAALAAPAFAAGVIHSNTTEMGYTSHPDHAQAGKTRAQVRAELDQARSEATWPLVRIGATPSRFTSNLTREQVSSELQQAQQHPSWSARRVGAPVSMN